MRVVRAILTCLWLVVLTPHPAGTSAAAPTVWTLQAVRVVPANTGASVRPGFAVDARGTVFFYGGSCGGMPDTCWCDVLEQRPGQHVVTRIAGYVPGSSPAHATPAQRLDISGCSSLSLGANDLLWLVAFDRRLAHGDGGMAVFEIHLSTGTYHEFHGCGTCSNAQSGGRISGVSLYGDTQAAFDPHGGVYLANNEYGILWRFDHGRMTNLRVRCSHTDLCPEWAAIDGRGTLYYIDGKWGKVLARDRQGHQWVVSGGGRCDLSRMHACDRRGAANALDLHAPSDLVVGRAGTIYLTTSYRLLQITPGGQVHVLAGNGRPPAAPTDAYRRGQPATRFRISPAAITVDPHGHVYFLDGAGNVWALVR